MKNIAIFQSNLNIGGIQRALINLLNKIDYERVSIDLYLSSTNNVFEDEINKNVHIYYLKKLPFVSKLIPFSFFNFFYNCAIDKEYDVAIDFNFYNKKTSLDCLNVKAKKKVLWIHNDISLRYKKSIRNRISYLLNKSKYQYYDCFVGVSQIVLDIFKNRFNFTDKEYLVINNIIDSTEIIRKSKEKHNITIDNKKVNFCSVGRLVYQKGYDVLIEHIKKLVKERTDFHWYILGDGEKRKFLENKIKEYGLNEYVTLLGYQNNPYAIMRDMDAFILTSRHEGQPVAFLEAKMLGLPIIMPKHLEKYMEIGIIGTNDVLKDLLSLEKKKYDAQYDFDLYNQKNLDKIYFL